MREAPLGHDGAAAGNDARDAMGSERNVAKQDPGVNGEIIDSLIALLDESVAIDFPGEFLGLAADFLECLVNGDGSDGDRGIANNPLTRLMNIFAGGKIHDGIGAPL